VSWGGASFGGPGAALGTVRFKEGATEEIPFAIPASPHHGAFSTSGRFSPMRDRTRAQGSRGRSRSRSPGKTPRKKGVASVQGSSSPQRSSEAEAFDENVQANLNTLYRSSHEAGLFDNDGGGSSGDGGTGALDARLHQMQTEAVITTLWQKSVAMEKQFSDR
jgi:hypothetical protein